MGVKGRNTNKVNQAILYRLEQKWRRETLVRILSNICDERSASEVRKNDLNSDSVNQKDLIAPSDWHRKLALVLRCIASF